MIGRHIIDVLDSSRLGDVSGVAKISRAVSSGSRERAVVDVIAMKTTQAGAPSARARSSTVSIAVVGETSRPPYFAGAYIP